MGRTVEDIDLENIVKLRDAETRLLEADKVIEAHLHLHEHVVSGCVVCALAPCPTAIDLAAEYHVRLTNYQKQRGTR